MVYLLHFNTPVGNANHKASHYIGYCRTNDQLSDRLAQHRAGAGARITAHLCQTQHSDFLLARTWPNQPRTEERRLKRYHKSAQLCPICKQEKKNQP